MDGASPKSKKPNPCNYTLQAAIDSESKIMNSRKQKSIAVHRRTSPGASPGTLVADPQAAQPDIHVIQYEVDAITLDSNVEIDALTTRLEDRGVTWVDVYGLGNIDLIKTIGERFDIHELALEDIINVHQRPKLEEYDDHLFIVARMYVEGRDMDSEQLSIFVGKNYVLTFQERSGDCLEPVRNRIRQSRGRIRKSGADYLSYAILDAVIDAYFPVLENYGETVEALEGQVTSFSEENVMGKIHQIKRDLLALRRAIWPMREAINALIRDETPLIKKQTRVYLRDCYDHTVQLMDMVETYREIAASLVDIQLSALSMRMNEVMKVLTIIATIFIPLGFIAGVYGMNFDRSTSPWNMPELGWYLGYPFAIGVMSLVAFGLALFFWRKGWFGGR